MESRNGASSQKYILLAEAKLVLLHKLEANVVLVAIGRRPYIEDLNLENFAVEVDSRRFRASTS
jgi:pyruvate/2-oxoglutarate dehydrogenase complex dihydrolipoamide dehydrogenase (E3) component